MRKRTISILILAVALAAVLGFGACGCERKPDNTRESPGRHDVLQKRLSAHALALTRLESTVDEPRDYILTSFKGKHPVDNTIWIATFEPREPLPSDPAEVPAGIFSVITITVNIETGDTSAILKTPPRKIKLE